MTNLFYQMSGDGISIYMWGLVDVFCCQTGDGRCAAGLLCSVHGGLFGRPLSYWGCPLVSLPVCQRERRSYSPISHPPVVMFSILFGNRQGGSEARSSQVEAAHQCSFIWPPIYIHHILSGPPNPDNLKLPWQLFININKVIHLESWGAGL